MGEELELMHCVLRGQRTVNSKERIIEISNPFFVAVVEFSGLALYHGFCVQTTEFAKLMRMQDL